MMPRQLLVESIRIDGQTQSRERINEETVTEYAEAMAAPVRGAGPGQAWPPLTVFFDGTDFWLADGFHRLMAARRIGRKNIVADVKQGTREDAAWASCAANQTHGLRRSNADKRKAVEIALGLHPEMSDEAIGRHVGVSRDFAMRTRHELQPQPAIGRQVERRVGVDGRTRNVPVPATQYTTVQGVSPDSKGTAGHGPAPRPHERQAAGGPPPGRPPVAAAPAAAEPPGRNAGGPVDDVGRRIPDHLVELWGRRQEVQDMLTAISRVRVALREAQDTRDPLFSEVPYSSALAHLDQAYDAVQVAKPYAVCAFCQGHGCKACGQRGLLGKFRWDTAVPREHKEAVARIVERERGGGPA